MALRRPPHSGSSRELWAYRVAADIRVHERALLVMLVATGLVAVFFMIDWWFRAAHVSQPVLFLALSLAFWYGVARIVIGWINYLAIAKPRHVPAPRGLRVAIFTTSAPGEPLEMFEKTLAACARVAYPHTTYLLDDTRDHRVRDLAARHGAIWLELLDLPGAKAGKINRALELTDEPFILILDPDHIPFPQFLDRVLGHFDDARVGFVQVAQAYYNQRRSFTAAAAAEQTYVFYGPGLMGLYGHHASLAIGANCTFRREALRTIGGHGVGLAEDLITAIRLHAAGWRSVYVPEIVSRGLVPEDLGSYFKQQLKWSRGVYEVLFSELPRLFGALRWRQRASYLTIGTYYLCGLTTATFLTFPYIYLWSGVQPAAMQFSTFVVEASPIAAVGITMYLFVQRWLCDPGSERGLHWRGMTLKLACWPIYLLGTVLAIARAEIPYIPTAKQAVRGRFFRLAWPQLMLMGVYGITLVHVLNSRLLTEDTSLTFSPEAIWGMLSFATVPVIAGCGALYAAWQSRHGAPDDPWASVDIETIGGTT